MTTLEEIPSVKERPLLERESAGLLIELVLVGDDPVVRITEGRGTEDEHEYARIVPTDKVLDAFEHPYLYV